ncbi:RagB/SusD family nutrient uptake outer membrane protein [Ohtaekwangia sp.]|uniref:RagB/SusD family nutrient uptake outer membrane protein n=1 Tax=Ohtaekwangia sp. TaxID=2066019 RepID=UPI002F91CD8D
MILLVSSCSDFLDVGSPSTQVSSTTVFEDDAAATSAMIGIYSEMMSSSGFASGGLSSVTLLSGKSGDDFINYSQNASAEFAANELNENNSYLNSYIWQEGYRYIYDANAILEGLSKSTTLTPSVKQQLTGEAKFVRAFCNFYLVNLFGKIPLVTTTDYRINREASRMTSQDVYHLIIADLEDSKLLLQDDYAVSGGQKTRPNRLAASALLARVYLYTIDYAKAEEESTTLIESDLTLEESLDDVFLKSSAEAIWQLIPPPGSKSTKEGSIYILTSAPTEISLSDDLMNHFEDGDLRASHWVGQIETEGIVFNYPFKYKIKSASTLTEYSMVLRVAEQYLIRSEARAQQGKLPEAMQDIDAIRNRAGLPLFKDIYPQIGKDDLLLAIEHERRMEFFAEWGHRWLDLKRTGRVGEILGSKPLSAWQDTDELYPVPLQEIQNNTNLLPQNPGY